MEKFSSLSDQLLAGSPAELIDFFKMNVPDVEYKVFFILLRDAKVPLVRVMTRMALKCQEKGFTFGVSLAEVERRCQVLENNSRRKFARRIYHSAPLFALALIQQRYPDYNLQMLTQDLLQGKKARPRREKFVKRTSEMGFRICMIRYLAGQLRFKDLDPALYHRYCNKIAGYQNGLKLRAPIILPVVYQGEAREYCFPWNETKHHIDIFVALANRVKSFDALDEELSGLRSFGN